MTTLPDPLRIELAGVPHAQPRPRKVNGVWVSTIGPRIKRWRLMLASAVEDAAQAIGEDELERLNEHFAFQIELLFRIPVAPKNRAWVGLPHWHKPDGDNLAKPVLDELVKAKVVADDSRIADWIVRKRWCRGTEAGLVLVLTPLVIPKEGRPAGFSPKAQEPAGGPIDPDDLIPPGTLEATVAWLRTAPRDDREEPEEPDTTF